MILGTISIFWLIVFVMYNMMNNACSNDDANERGAWMLISGIICFILWGIQMISVGLVEAAAYGGG